MVRRDEPGHDDRAGTVHDLGIARRYGGRDLDNPLTVDQDVGFFEVADLCIETEHDATAKHDAASAAVADQTLEIRRSRRAQAGKTFRSPAIGRTAARGRRDGA